MRKERAAGARPESMKDHRVVCYNSQGYGALVLYAAPPEEAAEKASRYADTRWFTVSGCGNYEVRGGRAVRVAKAS